MEVEEPRGGITSPFVDHEVTIEVPATSANLGPGFDSLGVALDYVDTLTASIADGIIVTVEGEGAGRLPVGERHLVVRAMMKAFEHLGIEVPGIQLHCVNRIPHSRGMGSSSAAIVGGLALARALLSDPTGLSDEELLILANEIEGHPDNVAPAIFGGFVISGQDGADVWAVSSPVNPDVSAVVFIPPTPVSTKTARGLLPEMISHREAAANAGRAALLVAALAGEPTHLLRATEDFLHQNYRASAMPESAELMWSLRDRGVPAIISGAGPAVLAFTGAGLRDADDLIGECPEGWRALHLALGGAGVRQRIAE